MEKIRPGLSAGRVQSPALRLIVEREIEIGNFESQEYWTIYVNCQMKKQFFNAQLIKFKDKKLNRFSIVNKEQACIIRTTIAQAANNKLLILKITKCESKKIRPLLLLLQPCNKNLHVRSVFLHRKLCKLLNNSTKV